MKTGFFHDEITLWHIGQMHAGVLPVGGWVQPPNAGTLAESPDSKRRLVSLLEVSGLMRELDLRRAPPATEADLRAVHTPGYLARLEAVNVHGGSVGEQATMGAGGYDIAKVSAGLTIAAVDAVLRGELKNAYALSRPPGHHCLPDGGMGFCFLSNIAIAVEAAIAAHGLHKVAVLDWDVHHGNGTEAVFYARPDVLTISLHQDNCFPPGSGAATARGEGKGEGYNLNIPLLPGGGHQTYIDAFERIVIPALRAYQPQLIIIACGYDANSFDPLGRMMLHSESYRWMMQASLDLADQLCGGKIVVAHEGGYAESYIPFCGHALMEALAGKRTAVEDPILGFIQAQQPPEAAIQFQRGLLDHLRLSVNL
jgi:acetoin utilization deacetylase AcuC-like enzyme